MCKFNRLLIRSVFSFALMVACAVSNAALKNNTYISIINNTSDVIQPMTGCMGANCIDDIDWDWVSWDLKILKPSQSEAVLVTPAQLFKGSENRDSIMFQFKNHDHSLQVFIPLSITQSPTGSDVCVRSKPYIIPGTDYHVHIRDYDNHHVFVDLLP